MGGESYREMARNVGTGGWGVRVIERWHGVLERVGGG